MGAADLWGGVLWLPTIQTSDLHHMRDNPCRASEQWMDGCWDWKIIDNIVESTFPSHQPIRI